jgi:hypothetical protein
LLSDVREPSPGVAAILATHRAGERRHRAPTAAAQAADARMIIMNVVAAPGLRKSPEPTQGD